jgi:hypothetical protein
MIKKLSCVAALALTMVSAQATGPCITNLLITIDDQATIHYNTSGFTGIIVPTFPPNAIGGVGIISPSTQTPCDWFTICVSLKDIYTCPTNSSTVGRLQWQCTQFCDSSPGSIHTIPIIIPANCLSFCFTVTSVDGANCALIPNCISCILPCTPPGSAAG